MGEKVSYQRDIKDPKSLTSIGHIDRRMDNTTLDGAGDVNGGGNPPPGMLTYYGGEPPVSGNEHALQLMLLSLMYMLMLIPFLLCWKSLLRMLRNRRCLSSSQAESLMEGAEETVHERINMVRLASTAAAAGKPMPMMTR